ncbi:MAG: class I SAM-dependent methyltransferase [Spirochaetales bacterium]|nr:class I SAM-dependent methyltransferase [Spirochaetales bacterium]
MRGDREKLSRELDKDSIRQNMSRFTRRAWGLVDVPPRPTILTMGCGSGAVGAGLAVELAVLSGGIVTAVGQDRAALSRLRRTAAALRLSGSIRVAAADILRFRVRPASCDVVWSEGAVAAVGFERAAERWRAHLKPGGFLAIHDEIRDHERKLSALPGLGFEIVSHFVVPVDDWLTLYFRPLGTRLRELADTYARRPDMLDALKEEGAELEAFETHPEEFASVFYVLKKQVDR